jgi:hypothetical protein
MQRMCMDEEFVAGCRVRRRWSTGKMRLGESNAMIRCQQVTCVVDVRLVVVVDEIDWVRYDATYAMDEFVVGHRVRGW